MTFMSRTFVGKTIENYKLLNSNPEIKKPENSFMRAKTAVDTLANATLITYYAKKTRKYLKMDIPGMKRCSIRGMRTYDILDMKKYKRLFGAAEYHAYFIYGSGNLEKSINGQELVVEAYEKFINQLKSNEYGRCEALTQNGKSIIINYKERVETARKAQAKAYSTIVAWIDREITNIKYENPDKVPYLVGLKAEALGKKAKAIETDTWPTLAKQAVREYAQQLKTQEELVHLLEALSNESELGPAREKLAAMQDVLADRRKKYRIE